ncbi:MAG: cytochrome P460 family protein [Spirochaetales bacterium]|nr:cytochrome P460 family protein [Spirochaetales bacterium]
MKPGAWILLITALLFVAGCTGKTPANLVPADYSLWASTVDAPLVYEIPGHTMDIRKIYINETGTRLEVRETGGEVFHEYPEGTIILKENYRAQESDRPAMLTAMIKARKDPRARGGWIWVAKDTAAGEERIFSDEFCFTCHQNANEQHPYGDGNRNGDFRDFVFYPWNPPDGE